jgi:hypothetical protein
MVQRSQGGTPFQRKQTIDLVHVRDIRKFHEERSRAAIAVEESNRKVTSDMTDDGASLEILTSLRPTELQDHMDR